MAAKKRTGKDSEPPSATTEGGFTVLMEHMERQNRATIEAVQSLREHVTRRFEETEARAGLRFDSLEAAVRLNSTDIKELKVSVTELKVSVTELKADVTELKADVTELKADVKELKADVKELKVSLSALAARVDRIEELLAHKLAGPAPADLEARIRRIEERLGLIP